MTNQFITREQYIKKNTKAWRKRGAAFRQRREQMRLTISKVAIGIGVSPSTIHRFERGYPISRSILIEKAYDMFLQLRMQLVRNLEEDTAEFLIDQDADEAGKVTILRREFTQVAEINSGDPDFNAALAVSICEQNGGSYAFTI
ncbi:helix-turn-helix transcriptional regulator [Paenibacillus sp. FSL W8-0426]|uniref:helix-turn-helix domain-containing protein n=1 Tax=Paenibacillus sp. FSL W8-0426 TaxID=2921714 RepID=UPI0030DA55CD